MNTRPLDDDIASHQRRILEIEELKRKAEEVSRLITSRVKLIRDVYIDPSESVVAYRVTLRFYGERADLEKFPLSALYHFTSDVQLHRSGPYIEVRLET